MRRHPSNHQSTPAQPVRSPAHRNVTRNRIRSATMPRIHPPKRRSRPAHRLLRPTRAPKPKPPSCSLVMSWKALSKAGNDAIYGDCAHRAMAQAQAHAHDGSILTHEQAARTGATLRAQVVLHIGEEHHKARFKEAWAPDPQEAPHMWSHTRPPLDMDQWLQQQALPTTWIDGMALQGSLLLRPEIQQRGLRLCSQEGQARLFGSQKRSLHLLDSSRPSQVAWLLAS